MSSFKDCIIANVGKGMISKEDADQLLTEYDFLTTKHSEAGAISKLEQQIVDRQIKQKANFLRHMKTRQDFFAKMDKFETLPEKIQYVSNNLQVARDKGAVSYEKTLAVLNDSLKDIHLDNVEISTFKDAVLSVIDQTDSKDPMVKAIADGIKKTFRYIKNESDTFGMIFGDLGESYFPRFYDKAQFRKFSDNEFVDSVRGLLKTRGMKEVEIREMILDFKKDVETDGLHSQTKATNIEASFDKTGEKNFALKRNQTRQLDFVNGEAYLAFNKKFGGGDNALLDHFQRYLFSASNDLGVAKTLGPMPRSLIDEAEVKLKAEHVGNKTKKGIKSSIGQLKNAGSLHSIRAETETLIGTAFSGDRENIGYQIFSATQNWMRASHLGSAMISALTDPSFSVIASKLNGGSVLNPIKDYVASFQHFLGSKSVAKEVAEEIGYITETFSGMMIGDTRFAIGEGGKGFTKKLADLTFKLSGLDSWTKNGRLISKVNANATIASTIGKKTEWDNLGEIFQKNLERVGISKEEWATVLKYAQPKEARDGRLFLNTNDLRISKEIGYAKGSDIADKLDTFVEHIKNLSINENNLKTDALISGSAFTGDGKVGTLGKIASGMAFQYKSFAVTILNNHLIPAITRAATQSKLDHLAMLTLGTGICAAIPLQIKQMINGKTPMEMDNAKFWLAAVVQGGGMGILGDFLLNDTSRLGHSFAETLAGPYLGAVSEAHKIVSTGVVGAFDDDTGERVSDPQKTTNLAWAFIKHNTPMNNLWYTRLLTERLLFNNAERMIDPNFDKKMKRVEKRLAESGQKFWWAPGKDPQPEKLIANKDSRR
jgi:hypothetical protein